MARIDADLKTARLSAWDSVVESNPRAFRATTLTMRLCRGCLNPRRLFISGQKRGFCVILERELRSIRHRRSHENRHVFGGRVLLAMPPPGDPERRPVARSRAGAIVWPPRMVCTQCGIIGADARAKPSYSLSYPTFLDSSHIRPLSNSASVKAIIRARCDKPFGIRATIWMSQPDAHIRGRFRLLV
jgi:hypothetical protein